MADTVATLVVDLIAKGGDDVAARLKELDARLKALDAASRKGAGGLEGMSAAQARAATTASKLALEQQRIATEATRTSAGQARISAEVAKADAAQSRAAISAIKLAEAQARAGQAASGGASSMGRLATAAQGLQGALGAAGIAVGVGAIIQLGGAAIGSANSLEKTEATLRAVAGSQEAYDRIVAVAAQNQKLFGGSLEASLAPLQQFQFIANRTGASIEELNRVAQLLATVNPAEGIAGAGFALSEAFSGDITSIVERFNLPRQAVRELVTESTSAADTIKGITDLLAQQGVTSETLAASLNTNAAAYDQLGAQASTAFTNIGAAAAAAGKPVAEFLAAGLAGFNQLAGMGEQVNQVALATLTGATSFADYAARAAEANAQLTAVGQSIIPLTEAQYAYAQSLIATGTEATAAFAAVGQAAVPLDAYNAALAIATQQGPEAAAAIAGFEATVVNASATSAAAGEQIITLADAFITGEISAAQLAAGLDAVELSAITAASAEAEAAAQADNLAATQQVAAASMDLASLAAQAETSALAEATQAAFEKANAGATLEEQARAAAEALLASGDAGAAAAARLAGSTSQLDVMTAGFYRLEAAARAAQSAAGGALGGLGGLLEKGNKIDQSARLRARAAASFGGGGGGGGGTAARRPRGGGGGGGGGGASPEQKAAEKAAKAEQKANEKAIKDREAMLQKLVDLEADYGEQQAQIREDFAERMADASRDFGDQQVEDRVSFYRSLLDIEDQGLRQQASAQFEAAAQQAAALRDTKGADVAAAYEEEAAKIIAAQAKRQEEIKKLQEDGKRDEAQYLADLDKMEREAEQRRLDRIAEGEDSLQSQQAEALNDAQAAFAEKQNDVLGGAEAIGEAERLRLDTLIAQTDQLRQQAALAGGGAGALPASSPTTTPAGSGAGAGLAPTEGGAVAVVDSVSAAGLGAVGAKLDALLSEVAALRAITDNKGIIGAVQGLKNSGPYLP